MLTKRDDSLIGHQAHCLVDLDRSMVRYHRLVTKLFASLGVMRVRPTDVIQVGFGDFHLQAKLLIRPSSDAWRIGCSELLHLDPM